MNFIPAFVIAIFFLSVFIETTHSSPLDNILRKKIEEIRQRMPCGINGGPGLVPFVQEFLDLNYNSSAISTRGFMQNVQVDHLNEFVVDNINFSLLGLRLDFSIRLPQMKISGFYNMTGNLRLRIANGFLDMIQLKATLSLKSLQSNISGILGSQETSDFFNKFLEESIPTMLDTYSNDIGQVISEYLMPIANKYLHQLTLSDIIGKGNGGNGNDDEPCVA